MFHHGHQILNLNMHQILALHTQLTPCSWPESSFLTPVFYWHPQGQSEMSPRAKWCQMGDSDSSGSGVEANGCWVCAAGLRESKGERKAGHRRSLLYTHGDVGVVSG